jgi:hypothetical protein
VVSNPPTKSPSSGPSSLPSQKPISNAPVAVSDQIGYNFYPFLDSAGYDIGNAGMIVSDTAAACTADTACKGFNSNGFYKYNICTPFPGCTSTWTDDSSLGFYVKL